MESSTSAPETRDGRHLLVSAFRALVVVFGAFLLGGIGSQAAMFLLGVESFEALQNRPADYTVVQAVSFVGFIVAATAFLAVRDEWDLIHVRRPALRDVGYVVGGVVVLGAVAMGTSLLVSAIAAALEALFGIGTEFGTNEVLETGQRHPESLLYMIPVTLLLVGPAEELVFRGVVQGLFRRVVGVVPAVVVASVLFGLVHYSAISSGSAWTYLFTASAMGLVLGGLYEYTETIAVPVAVHGLWNAALFALNWALITYDVPLPA